MKAERGRVWRMGMRVHRVGCGGALGGARGAGTARQVRSPRSSVLRDGEAQGPGGLRGRDRRPKDRAEAEKKGSGALA